MLASDSITVASVSALETVQISEFELSEQTGVTTPSMVSDSAPPASNYCSAFIKRPSTAATTVDLMLVNML